MHHCIIVCQNETGMAGGGRIIVIFFYGVPNTSSWKNSKLVVRSNTGNWDLSSTVTKLSLKYLNL